MQKSIRKIKKVLILGSGALKIGEAGEFDYSGSQAIKALKEEGIETILINPNIATIQTSEGFATRVYFLPVSTEFVKRVIKKERPQAILLGFGGQTALNCGLELANKGVLSRYKVRVLGTPIEAIRDTEDRERFVKRLREMGVKCPVSKAVENVKDALKAADEIGYPVIVRSGYSLGGFGSSICRTRHAVERTAKKALAHVPQILVEEYLEGWKEVEYEVVRDSYDNCITVCNMENIDPMGIHTGESVVVAPSQTLSNQEYHALRAVAIRVVRHLGIVGECNIQFALSPNKWDYRVIEVNARLSRSSALASKATGYPLAFVAAKLALGYSLLDLQNSVTKRTTACFEPALDYLVVKIPRWDLNKFRRAEKRIGSSMKSVGEVMAVGRRFEEALQKGLRMLDIGLHGFACTNQHFRKLEQALSKPTDRRMLAVAVALKKGMSVEKIHKLTHIDKWFLYRMKNIIDMEKKLSRYCLKNVNDKLLEEAKRMGFSDSQLAMLLKCRERDVRKYRRKVKLRPVVKQIDTLAAEFPAKTNYLYLTYNGAKHDIPTNDRKKKKSVVVLGGGPYRIGSSVEFDWCCVNAAFTTKRKGYETTMVNCNPETVSTDYDICDKLYFEELSLESVLEIWEKEAAYGVIISMGGQTPNNLALALTRAGARILGTSAESIDKAEDRYKFSYLLDKLDVAQPKWAELTSLHAAKKFAKQVGYPVLVRPSYVLSGAAMSVAFDAHELEACLSKATRVSKEHPVVISKFITNARELDFDGVACDGKLVAYALIEHVENAGIHSGDATMVLPPQKTYQQTMKKALCVAKKLAHALKITGPFNIQFIAKNNELMVIELNLRASRSMPFVSKVLKRNFIELATKVMLGEKVDNVSAHDEPGFVAVKAPQFSFSRLSGADPILSVEMASTGEVACFGNDVYEALLKSLLAAGMRIPKKSVLVSIGGDENRYKLLRHIKSLASRGFKIYSTHHTSLFLKRHGVPNVKLYKIHEHSKKPNVEHYLAQKKIGLVINIPATFKVKVLDDEYELRRFAIDFGIPLVTNVQLAKLFIESILKKHVNMLHVKAWDEY